MHKFKTVARQLLKVRGATKAQEFPIVKIEFFGETRMQVLLGKPTHAFVVYI